MANKQGLTQTQRLEQHQQLSAQQILVAKLTELSVEELRARIETECEENPWLERVDSSDDYTSEDADFGSIDSDSSADSEGGEDFEDNLNASANDINEDGDWGSDEFPTTSNEEQSRRREDSETYSFHDLLMQQVGEFDLDEHQRTLLEYLIGSLDDDGLLRTSLMQIADELDIFQNIRTNDDELERVLDVLQQFEPAGVGTRNLCECLLIQAKRNKQLAMRSHIITVLQQHSDEFVQNHWSVIQKKMNLTDADITAIRRSIKRLNPRPGGSIGSASAESAHAIVPDFIVETDEYGTLQFRLCEAGIPQLQMSSDPAEWMTAYDKKDDATIRRDVLEAIHYQRKQMDKGNLFIEALAQRRRSMISVMRAIIKLQDAYFREGDESVLRPMRLEDVARLAGVDISTVSRVCRSKSVQTEYKTFFLKHLFNSSARKEGEDISVRSVLNALKKLVDEEDKRHPLSDDALTEMLKKQGYDVARRTIAKHREQLGIPNSRMRK